MPTFLSSMELEEDEDLESSSLFTPKMFVFMLNETLCGCADLSKPMLAKPSPCSSKGKNTLSHGLHVLTLTSFSSLHISLRRVADSSPPVFQLKKKPYSR